MAFANAFDSIVLAGTVLQEWHLLFNYLIIPKIIKKKKNNKLLIGRSFQNLGVVESVLELSVYWIRIINLMQS